MKIVKQLIEEVSDPKYTLTDVLIRTKVLAHKLRSTELGEWIDGELNGYSTRDLPAYRIQKGMVVAIIETSTERISNFKYPLALLEDDTRRALETFNAKHSISTLQEVVTSNQQLALYEIIGQDTYHYLAQYIGNVRILELRRQIDKSAAIQIVTSVKSKLLDFLLKLDDEIPSEENLTIGSESQAIISNLFNSAVLGNHTTIIIGNHNHQTISQTNISNFDDVRRKLRSSGLNSADVAELEVIIDQDNRDDKRQIIGEKVKSWISSMLLKAMDGSWQIGLGAAGDLLSGVVKQYYGWTS
ncbi:MAG: hypothetical protein BGO21_14020 [Dyadobacter sp. 50-39]|uniref:AbiTii domain-containing protein n=1 Tax=Dyadobacter sp. 50-39 TaxID=1895756 RepID=UPI00095EA326|nr:hypothetical protein [Dyadobacter sp. 50-39]OJV17391.1 MAG: hypothetical protein BGO21_14020 [Dyadobacter sp. 50-39]